LIQVAQYLEAGDDVSGVSSRSRGEVFCSQRRTKITKAAIEMPLWRRKPPILKTVPISPCLFLAAVSKKGFRVKCPGSSPEIRRKSPE